MGDPISLNSLSLPSTLPPISSIFSHQLRLVGQYSGDCDFVVVVSVVVLLLLKLEYDDSSDAFMYSDSGEHLSTSCAIGTTAVFSLSGMVSVVRAIPISLSSSPSSRRTKLSCICVLRHMDDRDGCCCIILLLQRRWEWWKERIVLGANGA